MSDLHGMTNRAYVNAEIAGKVIAVSPIFKGRNDEDSIKVCIFIIDLIFFCIVILVLCVTIIFSLYNLSEFSCVL